MKNYLKIIPFVVVFVIAMILVMNEYSQSPPAMPGQEFLEKFDDDPIVQHFKSAYPENFVGYGKTFGMLSPEWGYGSVSPVNNGLQADLRIHDNFGKYEFTYTCGDVADTYVSVRITNPTTEDIDNNPCW